MIPYRDILLTCTVLGLLPVCVFRPSVGILVWFWLSFMNPHQSTWGFAQNIPFAMMIGASTLAGFIFSRERQSFIWCRETVLLAVLWVWFVVTSAFAVYPDAAWTKWWEVSKILLMVFVSIPLLQDRAKFRLALLIIGGSIGYYGLKGGIFALLTGGQYMILGAPGGTFISSNNALALALNMTLPFFIYLAKEEKRPWWRLGLWATFLFSILSVLFTYSRGGLLGLLAVLAVLFVNRRNIGTALVALLLVMVVSIVYAPERWTSRMDTIANYQQDLSANQRLMSWRVGVALANDRPITGGGFGAFNLPTFQKYMPDYPGGYHDAHSLYINLLGEHGYVGLGLFILLVVCLLSRLRALRRLAKREAELNWVGNYAHMLQACIFGYLATGAFLSVAYFDLAYQLFALVVILDYLSAEELARLRATSVNTSPNAQPVAFGIGSATPLGSWSLRRS